MRELGSWNEATLLSLQCYRSPAGSSATLPRTAAVWSVNAFLFGTCAHVVEYSKCVVQQSRHGGLYS